MITYILAIVIVLSSIALNLYFLVRVPKYDGDLYISTDEEGKKTFLLEVDTNLDEINEQSHITFKVVSEMPSQDKRSL